MIAEDTKKEKEKKKTVRGESERRENRHEFTLP